MEHLQAFIKECDRKIVLAKKRLAETQDDFGNTPEVWENTLSTMIPMGRNSVFLKVRSNEHENWQSQRKNKRKCFDHVFTSVKHDCVGKASSTAANQNRMTVSSLSSYFDLSLDYHVVSHDLILLSRLKQFMS